MANRTFEAAAPTKSETTGVRRAEAPERALGQPQAHAGMALLQLQRVYGNRHVQRVVAGAAPIIQPKLILGPVGDRYEREADRVARQVVRHTTDVAPAPSLQAPAIQRLSNAAGGSVDPGVQHAIHHAHGGQPLPDPVRGSMEQALGADFSGVRLHTDAQADQLNHVLQARAFTTGQDIFLRRGEYNPGSAGGRELLAHELTHVVQQSGAGGNHIVQRRVGYEFENTGIRLVKGDLEEYKKGYARVTSQMGGRKQWETKTLGIKYENLSRKEDVLRGANFTLEADDTAGSNVEFVLHGPRRNAAGQKKAGFSFQQKPQLRKAAQRASKLAQKIADKKSEPFYATDLDPKAKAGVIVHTLHDQAYLFQATAGVRLDKITEVFSNPSPVFEQNAFSEETVEQAEQAIAASQIPANAQRVRLVNLLTLIIKYVAGANWTGENVKEISPIMARTDFARLFALMPKVTRDYLRAHEDEWVDLVTGATRSKPDEPLSTSSDSPLHNIILSDWIRGMARGKDILKGIDPDAAMGGLGKRTDPGNPTRDDAPHHQPVFEFRHNQAAWPGNFVQLCETFFDYVAQINKEKDVD